MKGAYNQTSTNSQAQGAKVQPNQHNQSSNSPAPQSHPTSPSSSPDQTRNYLIYGAMAAATIAGLYYARGRGVKLGLK